MADTSIGTARIDVVVDADKAEATVKRLARGVDDFSKQAQQQYNQLSTVEKKRVDGLIEQARVLVLNKTQQAAFNSELRLSGPLLGEVNKLLAQNASRALAASLAFGLLSAGAVAAVAVFTAWRQGSQEATDFNAALIKTGNYASLTAREAQKLAEEMDNLGGVTQHSAMAALTAFAETGHFTGDSLRDAAGAAAAWSEATGVAVEDTIAQFEKIRKDPVKALLELNSTYHFLTKAQLAHIVQLQDEGREAEAAAAATTIYAGVLRDRSQQIIGNLGTLESSWRGLKNIARETWDELLAVGREDTIANRLLQAAILASPAGSTVRYLQNKGREGQATPAQRVEAAMAENDRTLSLVDSERASKELEEQRKGKEDATRTWLQLSQQNLDKKQKQLTEEKKITEAGRALGKSEAQINDEIAKSRARFAESQKKSAGGAKASTTDPTASILSRIKQQIALNQQAAEGEGKVTASQRLRIQVEEELARIGGKATSARRAEIEAGLKQVEVSEASAEAAKVEARAKEELARLTNQLTAAEQNRRAQNELDLMAIGRGGEEIERMQRRIDIEREYEDGLKQLRDRGVAEDSESYRLQEQALRESRDRMLADEGAFYDQRRAMMDDWKNGAIKAYEDYAEEVGNTAKKAGDLVTDLFQTSESALAELIKTGSFSLKDFIGDISDAISEFVASQLMKQFLAAAGGGGGSDPNYGEAIGSIIDLFASDGFGFASGGYTGAGGRNEPAGIVHKGEYVINSASTRALGRGVLDQLNMGNLPVAQGSSPNINITVPVYGRVDTRTRNQIANDITREQRLASRFTG